MAMAHRLYGNDRYGASGCGGYLYRIVYRRRLGQTNVGHLVGVGRASDV